jgi:PadR family transcriptional regulator PadR
MYELTKNEEIVLLSVWKLEDNAYGVTIRKNFKRITGKALNFGSLYNTLYLLVRRGLVESRESEPLSRQGGRRKVLYSITREGKKALSKAQRVHKLAWDDVPDYAFEKKND